MKAFLIALQFLTVLPVNITSKVEKESFGESLTWFPFVGALIGFLLSLGVFVFAFLPQPVIAAFILAVSIIITGGIHLDGFADTCDGLFGYSTKEKALEIMRDPHIGTFAGAGIAILLILKFSILAALPQGNMWKCLVLMAAFGRWAQVLSCFSSRYARQDGKAKYFIEYASWRQLIIGGVFAVILFILLFGINGLSLFLVSILPILAAINYIRNKIGGMTGDTIGAINEIAETSVLLFSLVFLRIGL